MNIALLGPGLIGTFYCMSLQLLPDGRKKVILKEKVSGKIIQRED